MKVIPTTEMVVEDFGLESRASRAILGALRDAWEFSCDRPDVSESYRGWGECLAAVYGAAVGSHDLFFRQTYLATVVKLIARHRIGGSKGVPDAEEIVRILDGSYFASQGIEGFCEEDFFSWIASSGLGEVRDTVVQVLWSLLQEYDLDRLSEDVLKSLYEQLVDPDPRHGLGEYYTPDWLAARMVRRLMDKNPKGSFLDPACGSGSFLYAVLREKRSRLGDSAETVNHAIATVSGIDINPLAVLVARTNYLLALGDLLAYRPMPLVVPIHAADSMCLWPCNPSSQLTPHYPGSELSRSSDVPDTRNRRFDVVMGNPPWISYRFLDSERQRIVRDLILHEYGLLQGRADLITHMELATLFLVRSSEFYAKRDGTISFVLPRSIFSADQHHGLRTHEFRLRGDNELTLAWREVWDCQAVHPLFDVPTCVLTAENALSSKVSYPIEGEILHGELSRRNASLEEAEQSLRAESTQYYLHRAGKRSFWSTDSPTEHLGQSPYRNHFAQGASMVPRSFWFVDVMLSSPGAEDDLPEVATAQYARSRAQSTYKDVFLSGSVERKYLYATLLAADLLPFGHLAFRPVLLPVEPEENYYRLVDTVTARRTGLPHLAQWLETVEEQWQAKRGHNPGGPSALEWLDYRGKLTGQNPQSSCRVVYNTSGTFLTAAVVKGGHIPLGPKELHVTAEAYVADTKTYYYETNDEHEAHYLAAVLNAPAINRLIKPLQSRGSFGPRDIHKKVFELPIPRYDDRSDVHSLLAEIGRQCRDRVRTWLAERGLSETRSIGRLRAKTRSLLDAELKGLNTLVATILK